MRSSASGPLLRRLGWLSVLLTGVTLFVSGLFGVSSVQGTLQAAQAEQRHALRVQDAGHDGPCQRPDRAPVRSPAAEV